MENHNKIQLGKVLENIIKNENIDLKQDIKDLVIKKSQNDYKNNKLLDILNQNYKFCSNIELILIILKTNK